MNAREYSVQNVLSSCLLPQDVKIAVHRAVILHVLLNHVAVQVASGDEIRLQAVTEIKRRQHN